MLEEYIVRNGAPTLAGIKSGSLFTCPYESCDSLREAVRGVNKKLVGKGLRVLPLRFLEKRALIYLFRPSQLSADLADTQASEILQRHGYDTGSSDGCVVRLARKLKEQKEFPHEIGLFLGYPPEDVHGFIENKACGYKCVGCWKVYGDEEAARRCFARYKACTTAYCDRWAKGHSIEGLTVAG